MRKHIKIVPIFLSFLIFISSVYHFSFISYAEIYRDENGHPHVQNWSDIKDFGVNWIVWLSSQIGAVANYDFALFVQNQEAWKNLWTESNVTISDSEGGTVITFSDDLVAFIKQALKEYAEESCGFWIMPTVDFRLLPGTMFNDGRDYKNLKTIVNEKGIVFAGVSTQGSSTIRSVELADIYSNGIPMVYVCTSSSYDPANPSNAVGCPTAFYGADTWVLCEFRNYNLYTTVEFNSFDEVVALNKRPSLTSRQNVSGFYTNISGSAFVPSGTDYRNVLISKDGRRVQVFKSLNSYKSYDSGTRPVYFGSKFYEDSGPVEVSFEDLEKYLDGKYDDFWEKMKDLIPEGSNLSEEELEKLVDSILEQLGEIGGSIGDVNESMKETNSWLEKIYNRLGEYDFSWLKKIYNKLDELDKTVASALSGMGLSIDLSSIEEYLATIVSQLDKISGQLEDMTEDEFSNRTDNLFEELLAAGTEIGEAARTKFPLSIPWDISYMLDRLGGGSSSPAPARAAPDAYTPGGFVSVYASDPLSPDGDNGEHGGSGGEHDSGGGSSGGGHSRPGGAFLSPTGAPVFELPFVISESMGIEGTVYVDMSDFEVVSRISRTLFTLLFAYGLVNLTFKAVSLGKDVFD